MLQIMFQGHRLTGFEEDFYHIVYAISMNLESH